MAPAEGHRRRGEQGDRNETVNSRLCPPPPRPRPRPKEGAPTTDNDADTAVSHQPFDRPGPERRRHISNWRPCHEMGPGPVFLSSARLQQRPSTVVTPTELPCTAAHRPSSSAILHPPGLSTPVSLHNRIRPIPGRLSPSRLIAFHPIRTEFPCHALFRTSTHPRARQE